MALFAMFVQGVMVDVDAAANMTLRAVSLIVYVSHTCTAHPDSRVMSTDVGSCAAVAGVE